jgi:hypothetical protein
MGTDSDAALLSLAGVLFDPGGQGVKDIFYKNIELQSCLDVGLRVSARTIYWWLTRSEGARAALQEDRVTLANALTDFNKWFRGCGARRIWSHGATFDIVLLDSAYRALGLLPPYDFRDARDTRTLFDLAELEYSKSEESAHQALHDAQRQTEFVQMAYRLLQRTHPTDG